MIALLNLFLCSFYFFNIEAFFWRKAPAKLRPQLSLAVAQDQAVILKRLCEQDTKDINFFDDDGKTILMAACEKGAADSVHVLLSYDADVNLKDKKYEASALFFAVPFGDESIIKKLIMSGADVAIVNKFGQSPLHIASYYGKTYQVELMLFASAPYDLQAKGAENKTALMYASGNGHAEVVKLLLEAGANPNIQDAKGKTALMYAVASGHTDVTRVLLAHDARVDIKDARSKTASYYASKFEIKRLLETA